MHKQRKNQLRKYSFVFVHLLKASRRAKREPDNCGPTTEKAPLPDATNPASASDTNSVILTEVQVGVGEGSPPDLVQPPSRPG